MGKKSFIFEDDAGYFEPVQALVDLQKAIRTHFPSTVSLNYNCGVKDILKKGGKVEGLKIQNMGDGSTSEVHSPIVINANGPWYHHVVHKMLDGLDIR